MVKNLRIDELYKRIMKHDPAAINEIETLEEAKEIIRMMKNMVFLHGHLYQKESNCCHGDEAVFWKDNENNAFVDSNGEMLVTAKDRTIRFKVMFCPMCGYQFDA